MLESQSARDGGDTAMTGDTDEQAIKLSLEKQRDDAILRARQEYLTQKDENGDFLVIPVDFDGYIERCQNAQDRYEEDLGTATDKFVEHVDVRFNLDEEGNWIRPDTHVRTSRLSSWEPSTESRFPQLSAEEKAIMVRGFERLRQQMGSDRGLPQILERRWPKLSEEDKDVVLREFKRLQIPPPAKPKPSQPKAPDLPLATSSDTEHREYEQFKVASNSQNKEGLTMGIAIGWQLLQRNWRKVALQSSLLALAFVAGIIVGRWNHGGPSDRFEKVTPGNARIMLDRKTGQVCWASQGNGYQYPTCLDLYKRY